jgi:hypothetical protein
MTDFDADETVAPPPKEKRKKFWTSDRIIGYSGAALALSAAFFPWYVFFNSAKFGIDATVSMISRNFSGWTERSTFSQSPSAFTNDGTVASDKATQDPLLTGTVPGLDDTKVKPDDAEAVDQPFPSPPTNFHLLHVSKGKALIEDDNGVYVVGPGSPLPDLSKVTSLEQRDGEWVIVTDKGEVYDASGKRQ